MNNLTEQRNNKFLNKVKEAGDLGYFDHELAEMLGGKDISKATRQSARELLSEKK